MIVPSLPFLVFACIAAGIFSLSRSHFWRQLSFLVTNIAFLSSFSADPIAFVPLICFLALVFLIVCTTRAGKNSQYFAWICAAIVAVFFWLKRYSFIPSPLLISHPYVIVGLSYVFFRALHLIIDNHQGAIERPVPLLSYLNYTLNFTSLTSGPIQRYQDYFRMEQPGVVPLNLPVIGVAVERIITGYFKVAVISMFLSLAQHQAIDALQRSLDVWPRIADGVLIAAIYPIYLYFNFSGYVDVVIGVARFFRIELPENFDRPFSSQNFIAFWGRWHITLSNWLKTYVYNPLMMIGMSRFSAPELAPYISVVVFFITFFLVGLWHGPTSEFLFFGFLQGGGVAANKLYQVLLQDAFGRKRYRELSSNFFYSSACRGLTFTWFAFTLFWFWSSWPQIDGFYDYLGPVTAAWIALVVFVGATVILALLEFLRAIALGFKVGGVPVVHSRHVRTAWITVLSVITVTIVVILDSPAPDIVYKTF